MLLLSDVLLYCIQEQRWIHPGLMHPVVSGLMICLLTMSRSRLGLGKSGHPQPRPKQMIMFPSGSDLQTQKRTLKKFQAYIDGSDSQNQSATSSPQNEAQATRSVPNPEQQHGSGRAPADRSVSKPDFLRGVLLNCLQVKPYVSVLDALALGFSWCTATSMHALFRPNVADSRQMKCSLQQRKTGMKQKEKNLLILLLAATTEPK